MSQEDLIKEIKKILENHKIPNILTQQDLLKYYGFSISWQNKWRSRSQTNPIPYIKVGGEIRYIKEKFEAWLMLQEVA